MNFLDGLRRVGAYLSPGMFPFFLAVSFFLFVQVYYLLGLPNPTQLAADLSELYALYGLPVLFFAALIESTFLISLYFPGSLVIVLSVYLVGDDVTELTKVALIVMLAGFVGYNFSYGIGRFGLFQLFQHFGARNLLTKAQNWDERWGKYATLILGFFPSFLSISCTYRGMAKNSYIEFIFFLVISLIIWVPTAILVMSVVIQTVDPTQGNGYVLLVGVFVIWGIFNVLLDSWKKSYRT